MTAAHTDTTYNGKFDRIKHLLGRHTPGHPIRRAVLLPTTGMVADKTQYPELPEVSVLSQLCETVFKMEPCHIPVLLERAFEHNINTAWEALYDDIMCGIPIDATAYAPDFIKHMVQAAGTNQLKYLYTVSHLATVTKDWLTCIHDDAHDEHMSSDRLLDAMVSCMEQKQVTQKTHEYPGLIPILQQVVARLCPSIQIVSTYIMNTPGSCILFLKHPEFTHLAMVPDLGTRLCAYTRTLHPEDRGNTLACIAKLTQKGMMISDNIGKETLMALSTRRFDIRVAAAAAVITREEPDPFTRQVARLIETLAATIASGM